MELLFLRHGETAINAQGQLHRKNDLTDLNTKGKRQAHQIAILCKEHHVKALFSSPEKRAISTATIIGEELGLSVRTVPELHERNWGEWDGKSWDEIREQLEKMSLDERYRFSPPGGESWEAMVHRLKKSIQDIVESENHTVAVITHGGALRALIPLLTGEPKETSFRYDPPNASATIFEYDQRKFSLKLLLDTSHLL